MSYCLILIMLSIGLVSPTFAETTSSADHGDSAESQGQQKETEQSCILENDMYYLKEGGQKCHILPLKLVNEIHKNYEGYCPQATNPEETKRLYSIFDKEAAQTIPRDEGMDVIYQAYTSGLGNGKITLDEVQNGGCFFDHPTLKYIGPYIVKGTSTKEREGPFLGTRDLRDHYDELTQLLTKDLSQALADAYFSGQLSGTHLHSSTHIKNFLDRTYTDTVIPRYTLTDKRFKEASINGVLQNLENQGPMEYLQKIHTSDQYNFSEYKSSSNGYIIRSFPSRSVFHDPKLVQGLNQYLEAYVY